MDLRRINNERFSIRFVKVCEQLNIKTVHTARKIFSQCDPDMRIKYVKVSRLLNELNEFTDEME